jgi:hypothetical protein
MVRGGVDLYKVQRLLEQTSPIMAQRYREAGQLCTQANHRHHKHGFQTQFLDPVTDSSRHEHRSFREEAASTGRLDDDYQLLSGRGFQKLSDLLFILGHDLDSRRDGEIAVAGR